MTRETNLALDKVRDKLQECRNIIDNHLYYSPSTDTMHLFTGGNEGVPEEDVTYCRKVYAAVCKAMDLL